jgi:hypothetical protein
VSFTSLSNNICIYSSLLDMGTGRPVKHQTSQDQKVARSEINRRYYEKKRSISFNILPVNHNSFFFIRLKWRTPARTESSIIEG